MIFFHTACALLLSIAPAQADIYSWIMPDGSITYSDQKPASLEYKRIEEKHVPVASALPPGSSNREIPISTKDPKDSQQQATTSGGESISDYKVCAHIMMELETLSRTEAVFQDTNEQFHTHKSHFSKRYDGKRTYLSDTARTAAQLQLKTKQLEHCDNSRDGLKGTSAALAQLEKQQLCERTTHQLRILKTPRLRTADSQLITMQRHLEQICQ